MIDDLEKECKTLTNVVMRSRVLTMNLIPISPRTEQFTLDLIQNFRIQIVSANHKWESPLITSEGNGDIMLEWLSTKRRLSIHIIAGSAVEYLKSWGFHILDNMEDGIISDAQILPHWLWFKENYHFE